MLPSDRKTGPTSSRKEPEKIEENRFERIRRIVAERRRDADPKGTRRRATGG